MRAAFVRVHRWLGLTTAFFLFLAGSTGAVIAWHDELDAALNPTFFRTTTHGALRTPLQLANQLEARDPRVQVTGLPLVTQPGQTLRLNVAGRIDPLSGAPYRLGFDQVALDPVSGAVVGRRERGSMALTRLNLMPLLYRFHHSLLLPVSGGVSIGKWLLGIVGILWLFDSVVALGLAFPRLKSWRKSFAIRAQRGGYALLFDLHRSGGVWVWGLLMVSALSSVSMNLGYPVVRPLVGLLSPLSATAFDEMDRALPASAPLRREQIIANAASAARAAGVAAPLGGLHYWSALNTYAVGFFDAGKMRGDAGLGNPWFYLNADSGAPTVATIPGRGSAGDIFMQAQFPLHSGRIAGLPGRILISLTGLAVAVLSATGVAIWWRKRRARR